MVMLVILLYALVIILSVIAFVLGMRAYKTRNGEPVKIFLAEGAVMPIKNNPADGGYDISLNLNVLAKLFKDKEWVAKYVKNAVIGKTSIGEPTLHIKPNGRVLIPTGISTSFSPNFKLNVRPRSGLAVKYGITLTNSPGLVDATYRDDLGAILQNTGSVPVIFKHQNRIAQIELVRNEKIDFQRVPTKASLDTGNRGGGFNSSGVEVLKPVDKEAIKLEVKSVTADDNVVNANDNVVAMLFTKPLTRIQRFVIKLVCYRKVNKVIVSDR